MSEAMQRRIAIIGAGFSGTATAVQLLRQSDGRHLDIVLLERGPEFGRGTAYAKGNFPYILNVPAARMAATRDDPGDFLRFAQRRNRDVTGEDFLPRALYGEYLNELLDGAIASAPNTVHLRRLRAEAIDVDVKSPRGPVRVALDGGGYVSAEFVVVASGVPPPRLPSSIRCTVQPPAIRREPWADGKLLAGRGPMLILGTGLTMVDVVCEAIARHPDVEIHAISRHGLLPRDQTAFQAHTLQADDEPLCQVAGSTRRLLAAVRRLARKAEQRGEDWREVITLVRQASPSLWQSLSLAERQRFLRHAQSYWDIHRHRLPAAVLARIEQLRQSGQLVVHAGRIEAIQPLRDGVRTTWIPRGTARREFLDAAEVVASTGPDYDVTRTTDRLWQSLLSRGLAVPDELRLGIRTGGHGALIGDAGEASERLFYVGPMLRADHWEATAVGELRVHAEVLASRLIR